MAYDKVVDSAVLEAGLTKIAAAIREKGGTTDTLAFPDAMAAAIAAIEAGEYKVGDYSLICGTIIFSETPTDEETISHPDVSVPMYEDRFKNIFIMRCPFKSAPSEIKGELTFATAGWGGYASTTGGYNTLTSLSNTIITQSVKSFTISKAAATKMLAGIPYIWGRFY